MTDTSYEEIPYTSNPFACTHPDGLAVVATLLGMRPAPVEHCRVLELGCAGGGNLVPMALALPQSRFVGIDLSPGQIADGHALIEALGLTNVDLRAASIMDVSEDYGQFDYIICHGVYSWVPDEVQERILAIFRRHLAPQGVAYVSYNTYPGWHMWSVMREMLSFHAGHFQGTKNRLKAVHGLLGVVGRAVEDSRDLYGRMLREEVAHLSKQADSYLYHEHLEDRNAPVHFVEFAERIGAKGLQFVEEAHFANPLPTTVPAEVLATIRGWPVDMIHREQYLDFLSGRSFRRSLLCHREVTLTRPPSPDVVARMQVISQTRYEGPAPDLTKAGPLDFISADNETFSTANPLLKAALVVAWEHWPRAVPVAELWHEVQSRLAEASEEVRAEVDLQPARFAQTVLFCYENNLVDLHLQSPRGTLAPGMHPIASPLARLQAGTGNHVTNLRNSRIELNQFDRAVLRHLDGTRDREAMQQLLARLVEEGELEMQYEGKPLKEPAFVRQFLQATLPSSINRLAAEGLLMG